MFNQSGERTRMDEDLNREKYLCINEKAAKFYNSNLYTNENRGMSFLQQYGLSEDTITSFKLGYAPASGHALVNHLRNEGVSEDDILKVGLASINNGDLCDKFCNRVMFPIINTQEKVIGFGGRAIDNSSPIFLNMPESEVFLKRDNLFGLNLTWEEIKRVGEAIIVEGYMDMIQLYQYGIKRVVATLGSSMTINQAKLICSYSKNVVLLYDSDQAGINSASRDMDAIIAVGGKPRIVFLDNAKDPADFIKKTKSRLSDSQNRQGD